MGWRGSVTAHHEIWWADAGVPQGRRPFLILTRDPVAARLNHIVVAPLTTTDRGLSSHLAVGTADGLKGDSWVNFDSIMTIDRNLLTNRVTALSPARSDQACAVMSYALGCGPPPFPSQ